jgi:hypothetical protein
VTDTDGFCHHVCKSTSGAHSPHHSAARRARRSAERGQEPGGIDLRAADENIGAFEMQLDRDHEIGGRFVSFGDDTHFHIADVGYWNPDIITFDGFDQNGNRVKLIQHVSQLNVLLVAVRKTTPAAEPPRRIGFYLGEEKPQETKP